MAFAVDQERHEGSLVVVLSGELDISTAPQLEGVVAGLGDGTRVVMDLTGLSFVDSTGMRTIVSAGKVADGGFAIVCPDENHPVRRLLDLLGISGAYDVHRSRAEAGLP